MTIHAKLSEHQEIYSALHELQRSTFTADGIIFLAYGPDAQKITNLVAGAEVDFNVDMRVNLVSGEEAYLVSNIHQ